MATIKPIEGRSVHYIQSGQVIADGLNSAVKELVENSLDAHATAIEVRFKNYGLDAIEVADNGDGVAKENYENIALKHYTSKLTTYDDLDNVETFGFRGEALSSLCALSNLQILTATKEDAPKGSRLDFETSGKLKSVSVVAAQKGTTVIAEDLFRPLPVRRKELERNIKREYTKVLGLLQAYASISTNVKFSVFNQPAKGKKTPVFATKANPTTRENISNVFGAKTLTALVPLDLEFELQTKARVPVSAWVSRGEESKKVRILGHISRPVVGEGRQAPDRQMFFVNSRPCNLPQVSRAINEVYKQYNVTQSPFIFADLRLDTNAYDVNVSPDKRTILLHDQADLLESLKTSLTELFDNHDQTVPHGQLGIQNRQPAFRQLTMSHQSPSPLDEPPQSSLVGAVENDPRDDIYHASSPPRYSGEGSSNPGISSTSLAHKHSQRGLRGNSFTARQEEQSSSLDHDVAEVTGQEDDSHAQQDNPNGALFYSGGETEDEEEQSEETGLEGPSTSKRLNPFERMALSRKPPRAASHPTTITIGNKTVTTDGEPTPPRKRQRLDNKDTAPQPVLKAIKKGSASYKFMSAVRNLAAPGTQVEEVSDYDEEEEEEDDNNEGPGNPPVLRRRNNSMGPGMDVDEVSSQMVEQARGSKAEDARTEDVDGEDDEELDIPEQDLRNDGGDEDYVDEESHRLEEQKKVQMLIEEAEQTSSKTAQENKNRATRILKGNPANSVKGYCLNFPTPLERIQKEADTIYEYTRELERISLLASTSKLPGNNNTPSLDTTTPDVVSHEERLSLTISKSDFFKMRVIGQFNRGFIIATREEESPPPSNPLTPNYQTGREPELDLFIIDQHASDEKYNFEKLQQTTTMTSQPLVRPKPLDQLMAMDEEIVADNLETLRKNGFFVQEEIVPGARNKFSLFSLPQHQNTTFDLSDLEELIHLIHQAPQQNQSSLTTTTMTTLPRPTKVRKVFAMRACRMSIMVGKALTHRMMEKVVRHLGEMDKPWNCPHGRPTMRHLVGLKGWECWREYGDEKEGSEEGEQEGYHGGRIQWKGSRWEETLAAYRAGELGPIGED